MSEFDSYPQCLEPHLTIRQIAKAWSLSYEATRQLFENEDGVLKLVHRLRAGRRGYVSYRVPQHVAARVHARLTAGSRGVTTRTGKRADVLRIGNQT